MTIHNFRIIEGSKDQQEWEAVKQAMPKIKSKAVRSLLTHICILAMQDDNKRIQVKHILEACAVQEQRAPYVPRSQR